MPDVRPSPELVSVTTRFMDAFTTGNADVRLGLFSGDPALRFIGTGEAEVWNADMLLPAKLLNPSLTEEQDST